MNIWCMNLKDNRKENKNADKALKFWLCKENDMIAIGWAVSENVQTWEEYKEIADDKFGKDRAYKAAIHNISAMKKDDLVWVKNPVTSERYLAKILDEAPHICNQWKEKDICANRKVKYYEVKSELPPSLKRLNARWTIEKIHRDAVVDETKKFFKACKARYGQ